MRSRVRPQSPLDEFTVLPDGPNVLLLSGAVLHASLVILIALHRLLCRVFPHLFLQVKYRDARKE